MIPIFYAISGILAIFMCLFSNILRSRLYVTDSMVAILLGILIEIAGFALFTDNKEFQLEFSRICVGLQVMTTGINLPDHYVKKHWRSQFWMLIPVMTSGWLICSCILLIIPHITFLEALMIGACITPTDPVLANAITSGPFAEKYVPGNIRMLLSFESGANDGLGYPFLFLPIYLMQMSAGAAITQWFLVIMLFNVVLSIIIGATIGYLLNRLCKWTEKESHMSIEYLEIFTCAVSVMVLGIVGGIESDDILAVFVCGVVFNRDGFLKEEWGLDFAEGLDTLLNVVFFLYLGSILPIDLWTNGEHFGFGHLIAISILILLFKRLAVVFLFKFIPEIKNIKEAFFVAWFGPMGVSSLFYCLVLLEKYESELAYSVVTFVIFVSVFVHGISVPVIVLSDKIEKITGIKCSLLWKELDRGNTVSDDGSANELASAKRRTDEEAVSLEEII